MVGYSDLWMELRVQPAFSLRRVAFLCEGHEPDSITLGHMLRWHGAWLPLLRTIGLGMDDGTPRYIALWLPQSVEEAVDAGWNIQPSHGFLLHSVAVGLCMGALAMSAPNAAQHGCAPLPLLALLESELRSAGFPLKNRRPANRYSAIAHTSFKDGCRACMLDKECRRASAPARKGSPLCQKYSI
jgi:hypothetical protein